MVSCVHCKRDSVLSTAKSLKGPQDQETQKRGPLATRTHLISSHRIASHSLDKKPDYKRREQLKNANSQFNRLLVFSDKKTLHETRRAVAIITSHHHTYNFLHPLLTAIRGLGDSYLFIHN